ncbi:MAG: Holliday junction resolvase RuvX [Pseudomonadota bacterium]
MAATPPDPDASAREAGGPAPPTAPPAAPPAAPGRGSVHDDVAALAALSGPLIGLDLGTKTIGIAVSDGLRLTATPLTTLRRRKFGEDAAALERLFAERSIAGLVLGLPRNMDGSEGARCQATRAFARNMAGRGAPPVAFWDERLSTVAVEKALIAANSSRKRRAEVIDKLAAAFILQGALDRLSVLAAQR